MPRLPAQEDFRPDRVGPIARIREDIAAVMHSDPAARSRLEILLCYPGLHALWFYRLSHALWNRGFSFPARLVSHLARFLTGVEVHPGARIGRRVFIDHGMGVVIGETSVIEDDVLIYKGVLLGGTTCEKTVRHPWIEKEVVIGSNACILGAIVVGRGAKVGSGSVVIRDVPPGSTVVGVPGHAVKRTKKTGTLLHADLPDPTARAFEAILDHVNSVQKRLNEVESALKIESPRGEVAEFLDLQKLYAEHEEHEGGSGI